MKFSTWDFIPSPKNGILKYINAYVQEEYIRKGKAQPDLDSIGFKVSAFDWVLWLFGISRLVYDSTGKVVSK